MTTEEPDKGPGPPADEQVVTRDNRKVKPARHATAESDSAAPEAAEPATAEPASAEPATAEPAEPAAESADDQAGAHRSATDGDTGDPTEPATEPTGTGPAATELAALRSQLDERTADLQRVTAEYANYRRRMDRDKAVASEEATATVFRSLLPVFDDLDRAREHGELADGVAAVVEQLVATAGKFGLTPFGEEGEPFDPNRHEAVAHQTSPDVTEPTCVNVMRRGYLLGDRLLRAAMVAVAEPAESESS